MCADVTSKQVYDISIKNGTLDSLSEMAHRMQLCVSATPTSPLRNTLTDMNILRLQAIAELEQHIEAKENGKNNKH